MRCSEVEPTTPPAMLAVHGTRVKVTAKPSTAKMEITQPISSELPSPTGMKGTQTPYEPDIGYLEKEKEAATMSGRYYK